VDVPVGRASLDTKQRSEFVSKYGEDSVHNRIQLVLKNMAEVRILYFVKH
jgi:hypothetical protein